MLGRPGHHSGSASSSSGYLIGVGTGRYNGIDGYTIEFTLVDYGDRDRAAYQIFETATRRTLCNVPLQVLDGGNFRPTTTSRPERSV